jgi:hypothetical protein
MDDLRQALQTLRPYLERRCDELVGHSEGCPGEDEHKAICDVLDLLDTASAPSGC